MRKNYTLILDGIKFNINIKSRLRSINIWVKPPADEVKVSTPEFMPKQIILGFIQEKLPQIKESIADIKANENKISYFDIDNGTVYLWGRPYNIIIKEIEGEVPIITLEDENIIIEKGNAQRESIHDIIENWLRYQLRTRTLEMAPSIEKQLGVKPSQYTFRRVKTLWGSYSMLSNRVNISLNLVHLPVECLEYIVVHELAHLREFNHGKNFNNLVASICPDWMERKKLLNKYV